MLDGFHKSLFFSNTIPQEPVGKNINDISSIAMNVWHQPSMQIVAQLTMLAWISMNIHAQTHSLTHSLTHTHTHTRARAHTHTHARTQKAKSPAAAKWSRQPSDPALGYLGTTQALRAGASKPPGGGLVPHRWSCTMPQGDGVGTQSPTWTSPISETWTAVWHLLLASPVYTRYPLMLHLGGLLPQLAPGHQIPI